LLAGVRDRIVMGAGIAMSDISFARQAGNLVLLYGAQGDRVQINNYFTNVHYQIEELEVCRPVERISDLPLSSDLIVENIGSELHEFYELRNINV
jgi:hypothetical protein